MNNYFRWPFLRPHPVSSPFGPRDGGFHRGVDFGWNIGDDEQRRFLIVASADGVVDRDEFEPGGAGDWLRIAHAGNESTVYMHMSTKFIHIGDEVLAGAPVGISGESGGVPTHLHFEIWDGARPVDPLPLLEWPPAPPPPLPPATLTGDPDMQMVMFDFMGDTLTLHIDGSGALKQNTYRFGAGHVLKDSVILRDNDPAIQPAVIVREKINGFSVACSDGAGNGRFISFIHEVGWLDADGNPLDAG